MAAAEPVRTRTPGLAVALAHLPPASRVLDAACGDGQHLVDLERHGHRVVGADASAAMLRAARRRTGAPLVRTTWATLGRCLRTSFDAVLCLGNSVAHCPTADDRRAALRSFASLSPLVVVDSHDWEVVHAEGSGHRIGVGGRRHDWHVPDRFGDPYVLTITDGADRHEVVSHPFTRAALEEDLAAAGLVVGEVVATPGDDRYTVVAASG